MLLLIGVTSNLFGWGGGGGCLTLDLLGKLLQRCLNCQFNHQFLGCAHLDALMKKPSISAHVRSLSFCHWLQGQWFLPETCSMRTAIWGEGPLCHQCHHSNRLTSCLSRGRLFGGPRIPWPWPCMQTKIGCPTPRSRERIGCATV